MADLSDEIQDAAENPRRASADGQSAEQHSLPDLIAADRYLAARTAARGRGRGLLVTKVRAGGPHD